MRGQVRRGRGTAVAAVVGALAVALVALMVVFGPLHRDGAAAVRTSPTTGPKGLAPIWAPTPRPAPRPLATGPAATVPPAPPDAVMPAPVLVVTPGPAAASAEPDATSAESEPPSAAADSASPDPEDAPAPVATASWTPYGGPNYDTEQTVLSLEDPSRPTPDRGEETGHDGRSLPTLLVRPVGVKGPLPLVVFAHGYNSEPDVYETLLDTWAAAGYLVAAPELPGSARDLPGEPTESDIAQQALDLSFVITSVLNAHLGADPRAIAVAGHSDGGTTVATLAVDDTYNDPRIDAYLVLSGAAPEDVGDGPSTSGTAFGPMLVTVGTNDEYDDAPAARDLYWSSGLPKALVVVSGGDHIGMYLGSTDVDQHLRDTTLFFLDGTLRHDRSALDALDVTQQSGLTS